MRALTSGRPHVHVPAMQRVAALALWRAKCADQAWDA